MNVHLCMVRNIQVFGSYLMIRIKVLLCLQL